MVYGLRSKNKFRFVDRNMKKRGYHTRKPTKFRDYGLGFMRPNARFHRYGEAARAIQRMVRGRAARKRMRWTARRAVGKARTAQARWRSAYFKKYGRTV